MKSYKAIVCAVYLVIGTAAIAVAQDKTDAAEAKKDAVVKEAGKTEEVSSLFGFISLDKIGKKGYGAIDTKTARFRGGWGVFTGMRGALSITDNFMLGMTGYGLVSGTKVRTLTDKRLVINETAHVGYGGLLIAYHFFPKKVVSFSVGSIVGAGGLNVGSPWDRWKKERYHGGNQAFFIAEPELNVYVNIFELCRLGVGGSYRLTRGINKRGVTNGDVQGFSIYGSVQAGVF
ncbi:MAG: hypothetical protein MUD12_14130 [Spirochaetes bacterium]|jgi:hypothetical protein|nr:hypothetical protein [Spirochaetota bacterium]